MGATRLSIWEHFVEGEKISLDSAVFIYHLNRQPPYFPLCMELLRRIETGHLRGVISVVNEMEMLATAPVQAQRQVINDVEQLLRRLPRLEILPVDRTIARRAAELRARSRLKGLDAIIAATALTSGCRYIVGNDREFATRVMDISYLLLDDFV